MCLPPSVLAWVWRGRFVGVHPHVALSATRGKASPFIRRFFQPCFMAASKEVFFQPCLLADFKEHLFLCWGPHPCGLVCHKGKRLPFFHSPVSSHVCWLFLRNKCSFDFFLLQMPINRQATEGKNISSHPTPFQSIPISCL